LTDQKTTGLRHGTSHRDLSLAAACLQGDDVSCSRQPPGLNLLGELRDDVEPTRGGRTLERLRERRLDAVTVGFVDGIVDSPLALTRRTVA
jgi:hypothetical protein